MTTPEEHRRHLGWTAETLKAVLEHAPPRAKIHARAQRLLANVPSIEQLEQLDRADPSQVDAAITAIESAYEVFNAALRQVDSPQLRRSLERTLRHYPTPFHFSRWRSLAARAAPVSDVILRRNTL